MRKISVILALLLAGFTITAACGPGGSSSASGLARDAKVGQLAPADAARFCDWTNREQGGYGRAVTCPDGSTRMTDSDQQSCTDSVPAVAVACPTLTVGDAEDCANAMKTDLCAYATAPACATLRACLGP